MTDRPIQFEITQEMIEAGLAAYAQRDTIEEWNFSDVVVAVYSAMRNVEQIQLAQKCPATGTGQGCHDRQT